MNGQPVANSRDETQPDHGQRSYYLIGLALILFFLSPIFAPYVLAPRPVNFYLVPTWTGIALLIGFASLQRISFPQLRILFALLILTIPALAVSSFHGYGAEVLSWVILISLLIIFAYNLPAKDIPHIYILFLIAGIIWGLLGLVVWLGWTDNAAVHVGNWALTTDRHGISGPFVNPNVFGGLICCSWVILVWFWIKNPRSPWLSLLFVLFASMAMATMSRSVFLMIGVSTILVAFSLAKSKQYVNILWLFVCILAALLLAQGIAHLGHGFTVAGRFHQTEVEGLGARKTIWLSSLAIWLHQPLFGIGLGQMGAHYLDGQFAAQSYWLGLPDGRGFARDAHDVLLQLMVEAGLPGLVFALLITVALATQFIRNASDTASPYWPALMAACMLWGQGMLNLTMTTPHAIFYFTFFFGIAVVHRLAKVGPRKLSKPFLLVSLFCIVAFMGTLTTKYTISWFTFEQWIKSNSEAVKKKDAQHLLQDPQLMPYFVDFVTQQIMLNPARHSQMPGMLPYIDRALTQQQMPFLYQGKFFALAKTGRLNEACRVGRFIQGQHWPKEKNQIAYEQACLGLPVDNYVLGWQ